jgi:hypothetical protein
MLPPKRTTSLWLCRAPRCSDTFGLFCLIVNSMQRLWSRSWSDASESVRTARVGRATTVQRSEVESFLRAEGFRRASRESDREEGSIPDIPYVWHISFRAGECTVDLDLSKAGKPLMGLAEVPGSAVRDLTEEVEGLWTVPISSGTMESKSLSRCITKGGGALTNRSRTCSEAAGSHPRPALISAASCCQLGPMRLI